MSLKQVEGINNDRFMKLILRIKRIISKRPFVCLLVANASFLALVALLLPFRYDAVDDVQMAWRMAGYLYTPADFHTFYMNTILTWVVWKLYALVQCVEWHTWLLLAAHLFSLTVIVRCIVLTKHGFLVKLSIVMMVYAMEAFNLAHLQFTITAGMCATAGLLLVVTQKRYFSGCVLFLVGSLFRYSAAMLGGVMIALFYPLVLLCRGFERRQIVALAFCAIGAFGLHRLDVHVYVSDPEWKPRYEYDVLRGKCYDNSNMWRIYSMPPEGITRADLDGFGGVHMKESDWEERDSKGGIWSVWPPEKLEYFLQAVDEQTTYKGIRGLKKVKNIPEQVGKFPLELVVLILVTIGCWLNCQGSKEKMALLLGVVGVPLVMGMVALNTRLVFRAFFCAWMPALVVPMVLIPQNKRGAWIALGCGALLVICLSINEVEVQRPRARMMHRMQKELVEQARSAGAKYLICETVESMYYPFGIRLPLIRFDIRDVPKKCEEIVDNKEYVFLAEKADRESVMERINQMISFTIGVVECEEMCCNERYVLFRLVSMHNSFD